MHHPRLVIFVQVEARKAEQRKCNRRALEVPATPFSTLVAPVRHPEIPAPDTRATARSRSATKRPKSTKRTARSSSVVWCLLLCQVKSSQASWLRLTTQALTGGGVTGKPFPSGAWERAWVRFHRGWLVLV